MQIVLCRRCEQEYVLAYSDVASRALGENHGRRYEAASVALNWNPVRGR
jgi:hypothetical protein